MTGQSDYQNNLSNSTGKHKRYLIIGIIAGLVVIGIVAGLVLGLSGDGAKKVARDISTPSKALIGHWRTKASSNWEEYYNPNTYISVSTDPASNDTKSSSIDYIIVSEDKQAQELTIREWLGGGVGYDDPLTLKFNNEATEMGYQTPVTHSWQYFEYVDSRQAP